MIQSYPKLAWLASQLLSKEGYSSEKPLVLRKTVKILHTHYTHCSYIESPFKVKSLWPERKSIVVKGQTAIQTDYEGAGSEPSYTVEEKTTLLVTEDYFFGTDPSDPKYGDLFYWNLEDLFKIIVSIVSVRTLPLTDMRHGGCDLFQVFTRAGKKFIHILGCFYCKNPSKETYCYNEYIGLEVPLDEFCKSYRDVNNMNYINDLFEQAKQTFEPVKGKKNCIRQINTYFNGKPADKALWYADLTPDTPDGNYIRFDINEFFRQFLKSTNFII